MTMLDADDIRRLLRLEPLPQEGGYFRETYRSKLRVQSAAGDERDAGTAIYYFLTPGIFSVMHRLPGDEVFHFYLGDPVEMLLLFPDGTARVIMIGPGIAEGMEPQVIVPGGVWQGCRLGAGGRYALMGTTMSPGFDPRDFEIGERDALLASHATRPDLITALTHPKQR